MSDDPLASISRALESARSVRLGKGVVSKTSYIAAFVVGIWLFVAWKWSDDLMMNGGLMLAGLIATIFASWFIQSTRTFAQRNPALALLEGAELIEWQKLEMAAKGIPPVENPVLVEDRGRDVAPLPKLEAPES